MNKNWDIEEVRVNLGLTIDMGDYESARIDAGLSFTSVESPDALIKGDYLKVFEEAWEICNKELKEKVVNLKASLKKQLKKKKIK